LKLLQRIHQFPDEADVEERAKDLALMADTAIDGFPVGFFRGPICSMPLNLVNRRLEILSAQLRQLPTAAIAPLQRFAAEGKLNTSQTAANKILTRQGDVDEISIDDVDVLELKPNFFGLGINLNHLIKRLVRRFKKQPNLL
jgi:hypothetical protein